jgi:hypothetical protein
VWRLLHQAATLGVHRGSIRAYIQVCPAKAGCFFCSCGLLAAIGSSLLCSPDGLAHMAWPWGQLEEHLGGAVYIAPCVRCGMGGGGIQQCFRAPGCRRGTLLSHQNAGKARYGPWGWRHCTPRMDDPAIEGLGGAWSCSWVYGTLSCALSSCCWQHMCRICIKTLVQDCWSVHQRGSGGGRYGGPFTWGGQLQLWHTPSCDAKGGPCPSFLTLYLTGPILCGKSR